MEKYYVYGLVDPRDGRVKYIGKGSGKRILRHVSNAKNGKIEKNPYKYNSIRKILKEYDDIAYRIFFRTNDESEAYIKEAELILSENTLYPFGWNLTTEAGRGPSFLGREHSQKTKDKIKTNTVLSLESIGRGKGHSRPPRTPMSEGKYIRKRVRTTKDNKIVTYYEVKIIKLHKYKYIGQSKSYTEAIKIRDEYLKREIELCQNT